MVAALKAASETALRIQIEAVAVTAPWMVAWDDQVPADSVINDALWLADLEPVDLSAISETQLGEINTVLVSEEWWVGNKHSCTGHWMPVEGELRGGGPVF